jgi:hypothetical protein
MSLARGVRKGQRKPIIVQHRLIKFLEAFDKYLNGQVPAEFVADRGRKLKAIGGCHVSKR